VEHVGVPADTAQESADVVAGAIEGVRQSDVLDPPLRLTWTAFSTSFFPGRRRHDLEVLTAFAKYTAAGEDA
jgi:hypothetical protein